MYKSLSIPEKFYTKPGYGGMYKYQKVFEEFCKKRPTIKYPIGCSHQSSVNLQMKYS